MEGGLRKRVNEIIEQTRPGDTANSAFNVAIVTIIVLNVAAIMVETVQPLSARWARWLDAFEVFSVAVFSIEYLLRLWSCTVDPRYGHPVTGRLRFALKPIVMVDLLAVLPFYLTVTTLDLRFLRVFRLLRFLRIAKLARYAESMRIMQRVIRNKREELIVIGVVLAILLTLSASLLYLAEHTAQPERFSSIPAALWWAVETLLTVGHGDTHPITPLGKVFAAVVACLGIGMFALPTGILGAGFVEEMDKLKQSPSCPHCGHPLR
jgi:voltage-gated potassium channel